MKTALVELDADHPGFSDQEYRARRDEIARIALEHRPGSAPPRVVYSPRENATWATVYRELTELYPTHGCAEFNQAMSALGYGQEQIPQLADVSAFLKSQTGFQLQPVAGLVSARDFLTALSKRVFCSTQYIRHHSNPHYTPEPDVVHELMGHAPMLAIPAFAELSVRIGEGACAATEAQVEQLATLYWYTIEFGVVRQHGTLRAYGAGLLSSYGELRRVQTDEVQVRRFDPDGAKNVPYPITSYQPILWEVSSIREAFEIMDGFVRSLSSQ